MTLQAAKLAVLRTLRALGGFGLVAGSGWRRRRLLILCYHGFSLRDEHRWNPDLYVTGEHFARRPGRWRTAGIRSFRSVKASSGCGPGRCRPGR